MFVVDTTTKDSLKEFPFIKEWIKGIKKFIIKDMDESKIVVYYTYGFFVPKSKNNPKNFIGNSDIDLLFVDRLKLELSKVRVDVNIEIGNFGMSNRLPKGVIPKFIEELVTEIIKVRMTIEYEIFHNEEVMKSIPPLTGLIEVNVIRESLGDEFLSWQPVLDIDDILDKISGSGIESLSPEEKDFLDKKSKDV